MLPPPSDTDVAESGESSPDVDESAEWDAVVDGDGVAKRGASVRIGERSGRRGLGFDMTSWSSEGDDCAAVAFPIPRPVGRGAESDDSSRSALRTRTQMCLQMSSDIRGPGSPSSSDKPPSLISVWAAGEELIR